MAEPKTYFTAHISVKKVTKAPSVLELGVNSRPTQPPAGKAEREIEDVLELTVRADTYTKLASKIQSMIDVEDQ